MIEFDLELDNQEKIFNPVSIFYYTNDIVEDWYTNFAIQTSWDLVSGFPIFEYLNINVNRIDMCNRIIKFPKLYQYSPSRSSNYRCPPISSWWFNRQNRSRQFSDDVFQHKHQAKYFPSCFLIFHIDMLRCCYFSLI